MIGVLTPANIDALLSGRRRSLWASSLRTLLRFAEIPYTAASNLRNRAYDRGRRTIHRAGVPVISVGNLTTGGTGKTPLVAWLANWFQARGVRVGIVSRGYKSGRANSGQSTANDEARELAERLPDVPHLQNPDRVAAARRAREEFGCELLILDDAFQHRRLHRNLDIVLLDALEPFGYGHLLPRGTLREPLAGLSRAHVVALSRANLVDADTRRAIQETARRFAPDAAWIEVAHQPRELRSSTGEVAPLAALSNQPLAAFCGIGNPAGFRRTLETCGLQVAGFREFADHHAYAPSDLAALAEWGDRIAGAAAFVCTHKDLVKINAPKIGRLPLWALAIEMQLLTGEVELLAKLASLIPRYPS